MRSPRTWRIISWCVALALHALFLWIIAWASWSPQFGQPPRTQEPQASSVRALAARQTTPGSAAPPSPSTRAPKPRSRMRLTQPQLHQPSQAQKELASQSTPPETRTPAPAPKQPDPPRAPPPTQTNAPIPSYAPAELQNSAPQRTGAPPAPDLQQSTAVAAKTAPRRAAADHSWYRTGGSPHRSSVETPPPAPSNQVPSLHDAIQQGVKVTAARPLRIPPKNATLRPPNLRPAEEFYYDILQAYHAGIGYKILASLNRASEHFSAAEFPRSMLLLQLLLNRDGSIADVTVTASDGNMDITAPQYQRYLAYLKRSVMTIHRFRPFPACLKEAQSAHTFYVLAQPEHVGGFDPQALIRPHYVLSIAPLRY